MELDVIKVVIAANYKRNNTKYAPDTVSNVETWKPYEYSLFMHVTLFHITFQQSLVLFKDETFFCGCPVIGHDYYYINFATAARSIGKMYNRKLSSDEISKCGS